MTTKVARRAHVGYLRECVTDADAAKLEAAVDAGLEMRAAFKDFQDNHAMALKCLTAHDRDGMDAYVDAQQEDLTRVGHMARAFDAAVANLEKP